MVGLTLMAHLCSMLFAGMNGREWAKVKWTMTCIVASVLWGLACAYMIIHDSGGAVAMSILGIFVGLIAAFILNSVGRFCIDFMALVILPNNQNIPAPPSAIVINQTRTTDVRQASIPRANVDGHRAD